VLLSVNVGFLAIQSVDNGRGHSLSQVASYVSVISSFGSMLLGVNIAKQSYTQGPDMVDNVVRLLTACLVAVSNERIRLASMAGELSAPQAWPRDACNHVQPTVCSTHVGVRPQSPLPITSYSLRLIG
jgi:hypothetical protein